MVCNKSFTQEEEHTHSLWHQKQHYTITIITSAKIQRQKYTETRAKGSYFIPLDGTLQYSLGLRGVNGDITLAAGKLRTVGVLVPPLLPTSMVVQEDEKTPSAPQRTSKE